MKYFRYKITDDEIESLIDTVDSVPPEFIETKNGFTGTSTFYKIEGKKITSAITEAMTEETAHQRLQEFISSLNSDLI